MTAAMIALTAMVLCVYLLPVEGGPVCQVRGKGKLKQFNGKKVSVRIPCKFHAITFTCEGYTIHVAPGMALDNKNRYYTTSAWIQIRKKGSGFSWSGRTSAMRLARLFNGSSIHPFRTKQGSVIGDTFRLKFEQSPGDRGVTIKASDASWKLYFYGYDSQDADLRKGNGVKIQCKEPIFDPLYPYPLNLCGNGTDAKEIDEYKKSLKVTDRINTVMYHILENMGEVSQSSDLCKSAGTVFSTCNVEPDEAVEKCSPLLSNPKALRYMTKFNLQPMQEFLSCMKYMCHGDADSCDLVAEHMASTDSFSITCPPRE